MKQLALLYIAVFISFFAIVFSHPPSSTIARSELHTPIPMPETQMAVGIDESNFPKPIAAAEYKRVAISNPSLGGSGYFVNQCVWWSAIMREKIGSPVPNNLGNAYEWLANAIGYGIPTGNVPVVGAVIVFTPQQVNYYLGHVGIVIDVSGAIFTISEMNWRGLGVVDNRTLISDGSYNFIYE